MYGLPPFYHNSQKEMFQKIRQGQFKFSDKVKAKIDNRNEVNTNISVLDQQILEQRKRNELAELERHREEATRYQLQLETLRNDQRRLETNAAYSNETNAKLRAENTALERSYASLQESLTQQVNELKETYDTNLDQLSQRAYECVKVAKRLKKYDKTGITININKRKPIKVDSIVLDLELIKNLNNQMDAYFNNKASTSLNTFITTFYEPLSNSEPTLLNANSGKIFVFVYSMYKIISNKKENSLGCEFLKV